jgi:hypothetical protein
MILAPLAGLLAGARAAAGHGSALLLIGAVAGLLTGIAVYPGAFQVVRKAWTGHTRPTDGVSPPNMPWWVWALICYVWLSPITATFLSGVVVRWVIGSSLFQAR